MLVYNYDNEGIFTRVEICPLDPLENKLHPETGPHYQYPANATTVAPPAYSETQQARWAGQEWLLEDKPIPPPTEVERLASLEAENKLLKAQNQALAERGEFIEDVIAEMAMDFYA